MADSSRARCRWPSGNTFLINLLAQSHVFRHAEEKIKAGELWFGLVERRVTWGMLIGSQLVIDKSLAILWASDRQARSGFVILSQDTSSMGFRSKRSLADGQMCSGTKKKRKDWDTALRGEEQQLLDWLVSPPPTQERLLPVCQSRCGDIF